MSNCHSGWRCVFNTSCVPGYGLTNTPTGRGWSAQEHLLYSSRNQIGRHEFKFTYKLSFPLVFWASCFMYDVRFKTPLRQVGKGMICVCYQAYNQPDNNSLFFPLSYTYTIYFHNLFKIHQVMRISYTVV